MSEGEPHIGIFLVDDHEPERRGIARVLQDVPGFEVVGEADSPGQALALIPAVRPDVALLEAGLPNGSGIAVCREVRSTLPDTYCLILAADDNEDALLAAVLAGASGLVPKDLRAADLVDAIRQAATGHSLLDPPIMAHVMERVHAASPAERRLARLTSREREVLELVGAGLTNAQVSERLAIAEKTVKNHLSSVLHKLGFTRRAQAASFGAKMARRPPPGR